jgi:hypothetical protein
MTANCCQGLRGLGGRHSTDDRRLCERWWAVLKAVSRPAVRRGANFDRHIRQGRYSSFTLADGYAVGRGIRGRRLAGGGVQVAVKVGFTTRALRRQLDRDAPFWSSM